HKTLDVITLFHKPGSPASLRVQELLRRASINASQKACQTSSGPDAIPIRDPFELEVNEEPPTQDQLRSIFEYTGIANIGNVVKGATDTVDAWKKLKANNDSFQRPLTVDWARGRVVAGDNESEILKLIKAASSN
ncbi:BgTH12-07380, partial [Blumeria graminis f. sp. triticale]